MQPSLREVDYKSGMRISIEAGNGDWSGLGGGNELLRSRSTPGDYVQCFPLLPYPDSWPEA